MNSGEIPHHALSFVALLLCRRRSKHDRNRTLWRKSGRKGEGRPKPDSRPFGQPAYPSFVTASPNTIRDRDPPPHFPVDPCGAVAALRRNIDSLSHFDSTRRRCSASERAAAARCPRGPGSRADGGSTVRDRRRLVVEWPRAKKIGENLCPLGHHRIVALAARGRTSTGVGPLRAWSSAEARWSAIAPLFQSLAKSSGGPPHARCSALLRHTARSSCYSRSPRCPPRWPNLLSAPA